MGESKKKSEDIVMLGSGAMGRMKFVEGDVIGSLVEGVVVPVEGVTRGEVESRLRFRRAALASDFEAAQAAVARGPVLGSGRATALPEDFPGREALVAVGIGTVEGVRALEDVRKISGIGEATAKEIAESLKRFPA